MTRSQRPNAPDFQKRYGVLLDIGRILTGTLQPDQLYRTIYEQTSRVLETTGFYISLYDAGTDVATVVFYADRGEIARPCITYRGSESRAIREAEPILEAVNEPERAVVILGPESDQEVTRSIISAPMLRENRVLGVISAQSYRSHAYSPDELELLMAVADLAAVAVDNARTVQEMERQRHESELLEEVGRALTSSLELNEVLRRIVTATQDLVSADGAGVWLLHEGGRIAEVAMTAGEMALPVGTRVEIPEGLYERALAERKPVTFDLRDETLPLPPEIRDLLQTQSAVAVPLVAESELIGALSVSHVEARTYPEADIRLLERFAYQAAIAVANAHLHEQVRLLSLTDPLTELPNRRHMRIFLEKEFAAAERGRSLTVILFDLDDFKIYNDAAGHQAGDAALRRFVRILANQTRAMNLAARYGGDEFISILSDTDLEGGAIHAGRVIKAVGEDELLKRIGVSAGIACYEPGMKTAEDLVRRADERLYESKGDRRREIPTP